MTQINKNVRVIGSLYLLLAIAAPALAGNPPVAASTKTDPGFEWSIEGGTQFNFGKLSIGAGYMGGGPYLDEKDVRRNGLHAGIDITIEGDPSKFQQPDVREGQILEVAGYKILIEKIIPGQKGTIILRVWGPPKS